MNNKNIPNRFVAKTHFGSFNIKIANREYITIGTKNDCVQIGYIESTNTAVLDWLGTEKGGCEINDKDIHGQNTINMVDLGFTILKQLYPNVNPIISLRDSSTFRCHLPDDNPVSISNMIYNLLLTGKTYYQSRFNATLKYDKSRQAYDYFIKSRLDPLMFDKTYNFNNNDLNRLLRPLLDESNNWAEFFHKLYTQFGRNSCIIMYSWYMKVYGYLAQDAIHSDWVIDISNRPIIEYTITSRNNSTNYTRKRFVYDPYEIRGGYYLSQMKYINHPFKDNRKNIRNITKKINN
jgi:hypothetical protein